VRALRYSPELLRLYELEWAEHLLPEVRTMDDRVGALSAGAAVETGLPVGLPVVLAPFDIVSTSVGVGAVEVGQACSILGTTLCTSVTTDRVDTAGEPSGFTLGTGVAGRWQRAFGTLAGTDVVDWAVRMLDLDGPRRLAELGAQAEPRADGPVFLPYLSPAGERAPFLDPTARGTFVGLSLEHRREELAPAVLEGLTMVVADCVEAFGARPSELRLGGGGADSDLWAQLIADVTGVPALRSMDSELGAKGAFITALVATGRHRDLADATARYVRPRDEFDPRPQWREHFAERHRRVGELRDIVSGGWRLMALSHPQPHPSGIA
jgi:xylulokinase